MKQVYDAGRKDREFAVGDYVWLKRLSLRQKSLLGQPYSKLLPRYYGPYPVLQKIGRVAYRLALPATALVHPVFHVTRLKLHVGELPEQIEHVPDQLPRPHRILRHRYVQRQGRTRHEVLVEWEGPDQGTSWEEFDQIAHRFPYARAWGQAQTQRGGSDTGLSRSPSRQDVGDAVRRRATPAKRRGSGEARSLSPRGRARTADEGVVQETAAAIEPDEDEGGSRVPSGTGHTSEEGRRSWPLMAEGGANRREAASGTRATTRADPIPTRRAGKEPMVDPRLDLFMANPSCNRFEEVPGPSGTKGLDNTRSVGLVLREDDTDSATLGKKTTLPESG
ncbi:uncharacterized protein LOC116249967 isoform X1 [Nymphaea colorata]|uniref:uncharacterized protein LOC116249967 isoform X1 n=1 Tax=Nymphaea colorata TaxID=210225 RepID=UPI00214EA709|nr:uncharacterized protein LOC116249967 isoform X1 [Nymphaea colorata]XP_049932476.1 uncharacterized protein LOC116249967 isoform X1 [Nymphaea colorata]XP_049932477.1 uncharacterized protein LOC116249967 isoform X1 [Nymphaea colorata]XP_049932478.1 uncharacterized protein LOC116249967 isoform X1 [Nymphaea colorata]XP_049932479.1 uncharacterized protein LOC116249967 isoform X1 [Nymphaea colorata]XP_049932480.1 uncharacterized protein LOC116249967 isoform X1 [Nymphaea colorata]XP_049932481.1 un